MENLTLEQKVVLHLAKKGYLTSAGDIQRALKEFDYANKMVSAAGDPGLTDDIKTGIENGSIEVPVECDHETLSNEEIQVVFDNDEK